MGKRLTVQQLNTLKERIAANANRHDIISEVGIGHATFDRIRAAINQGEPFARMIVKAQMREAGQTIHHEKSEKNRQAIIAARTKRPNAQRARLVSRKSKHGQYAERIASLHAKGKGQAAIAKTLGLPKTTVEYYVNARPKRQAARLAQYRTADRRISQSAPQIKTLRGQGLGVGEIAEILKLPRTTVNYHFYKKTKEALSVGKEQWNGTSSPLNKHVCVGIAYAETERFIGVLAEKLALPATFLRSRLSELLGLLGHSPLRS